MAKKKSKKRFKGSVSMNAAKQSRGTQYGHLNLPKGLRVFREEAKTRVAIDIMPYVVSSENHPDRDDEYGIAVPGELWYKLPYKLHRNIGASNESVVCPSSIKQKCPICEHRAQLLKDGADWNDDAVKALKPSARNLYIVIPKGNKNFDEKPHIWDISQFLFQDKLNEEIQENEEYETFPDLEEGFTLRIRFSEEQLGANKFAETSRIDFIEREEPYEESILDTIPSLDDLLVIPAYKTIEALFFGGLSQDEVDEVEDEEDEAEEETPPKKTKTTARKKVVKEEDDDDEVDEDEEEDATPPQKAKTITRKKAAVVEDDEEEEEEDEEEEEETPKEVKKAKSPTTKKKEEKKTTTKSKSNQCPHGHKYGTDCEEYDECNTCDEWENCIDAGEK